MNNSNSEDLGYDLVSDFDIKAIDTNTHDADPDQDPSTSSTKIQTASELKAIEGEEKGDVAIAESSESYISIPSETEPVLSSQ
jgi:hypothetical protein